MISLQMVMRLPFRQLQTYLTTLHGVHLLRGELAELFHQVNQHAQPMVGDLKHRILSSPSIQADETGWRENGKNVSIWSVSTLTIRYHEYHHSRGSEVVKSLIGEADEGRIGP